MSSSDLPEIPKRSMSLVERGGRFLAVTLRLFSVLQLLAGAGYIALAVVLQFPPGDPLTLGLWAIGCLAILTAICGCFGGCRVRCCLGIYVVLAVLALGAQLVLVLYLFIAPDNAEEQLSNYQHNKDVQIKENLNEIIVLGRWVLLGLLGAQLLAIGLATCLRCCTCHRSYEEFQEGEQAQYNARRSAVAAHLEQLHSKLGLAGDQLPAANSKRLINIHAVSGSVADRQAVAQQQQHEMRSSLFQCAGDEGKLSADMEAGKMIGSRVTTDVEAGKPWDAMQAQPSPASAWPQATTPPAQRSFKPTWSKAGKQ